jgi:hypothetical protein
MAATTQFMGLDKVNPIRVVTSNDVEITKNIINSQTNDYSQAYATIQAIAVLETNDCLVDSNNIQSELLDMGYGEVASSNIMTITVPEKTEVVELQAETNWFDAVCNFLSQIFG